MRRLLLLLWAVEVHAHQGGTVSKALFTTPDAPQALPSDGGLVLAPYTFASADAQFTVSWTVDLPGDPTGNFSFYYLDHKPTSAVTYDQILATATPIPEASGGNTYWVSCSCDADAGVVCPDAGPRTHCAMTTFTWNTSAVPAGTYWIIAANFDLPYKIYTVSPGPVRIAHGGAALPPAAIIILPDGLFEADQNYQTLWLATGQPPLHFDVFYGLSSEAKVLDPPTPIAQDITPILNGDGSFSYLWDTSQLPGPLFYYFGVKVTDATGQSSFTQSVSESVFHEPEDGGLVAIDAAMAQDLAPDLARSTMTTPSGCGCGVGGGAAAPLVAGLLLAAALVLRVRRRC